MPRWSDEDLEETMKRPAMQEVNPQLTVGKITQLNAYLKRNPQLAVETIQTVDASTWPCPKPTKYHAKRTEYGGRMYASKKEASYAEQLTLRQKAGEVWFWLEQVKFNLPGGASHRVDFMVFYRPRITYHVALSGMPWKSWELVEIKGRDLPMGKLKRRQVMDLYGVDITVE